MNSLSLRIVGAVEFGGDTVVGKQTRRDAVPRVALSKDLASATLVISLGDRASELLESHCVLSFYKPIFHYKKLLLLSIE
jgi:hypothetical protein